MKKLFALLLALTMVFSLATTAFAAEDHTITIKGSDEDHTYTAYQIFDGTLSDGKLTEIKWGSAITDNGVALIAALKADNTLKSIFVDPTPAEGEEANPIDTAEEVADILAANNTAANAEAFASVVASVIGESTASAGTSVYDEETTWHTIDVSVTGDGYYIVMDTGTIGEGHAATKYILQVLGSAELTVKTEEPTLDKEVQDDETPDTTDEWGETADYSIGDTVPFKLTATINNDNQVDKYDTYPLYFTDTMSAGLTLNADSITVKVGNSVIDSSCYTVYTGDNAVLSTVAAANGHTQITDDTKYTFIVWIKDTRTLTSNGASVALTVPTKVVVEFNATLNEKAEIGNVPNNKNTGDLWFDNNPNNDSWGSTKEDTVWVFTYDLDSNKTDSEGSALEDAVFEIRTNKTDPNTAIKLVKVSEETEKKTITSEEGTEEEVTVVTKVTYRPYDEELDVDVDADDIVTSITSPAGGLFTFEGLDAGTYYLVETDAPEGYNLLKDAITVVISAEHDENEAGTSAETKVTLTKDGSTITAEEGKNPVVQIVNKSGTELPTTGGMGTTLFYIVGGLMVAGAAILLVTKKRMGAEA